VTFEGHFGDLLTIVTSCAQLTRDLLATTKFLVCEATIGLKVLTLTHRNLIWGIPLEFSQTYGVPKRKQGYKLNYTFLRFDTLPPMRRTDGRTDNFDDG